MCDPPHTVCTPAVPIESGESADRVRQLTLNPDARVPFMPILRVCMVVCMC